MKQIVINDRVYGKIEIKEPVILALLESLTLQRLKGIDQAGFFEPHVHHRKHTRFEHSIGVYHLLQKFGASLEEQIAGLIHDVSHGVFSHCLDYALAGKNEGSQSHQDTIFNDFVRKTDIPDILQSFGFSIPHILNDSRHPLKENTIPDVCADRLDYSLRTAVSFGEWSKGKVTQLLKHLTTKDNKWVFTDYEHAKTYADLFYVLNTKYYSGFPSAVMFRTVGDVLSYTLEKNYLSIDDLYKTDSHVLTIIKKRAKTDPGLALLFHRMCNPKGIINNPHNFDSVVVCKSRIVDPLFLDNGKIRRYSAAHTKWKKIVKEELKPKKYYLRFP